MKYVKPWKKDYPLAAAAGVNKKERKIKMEKILFKLFKKLYVKHLDKQVEKYWNIYHFNMDPNHTSHNNEGDAFKHTFMAAELTLLLGENLSRKICILQEDSNPHNPPAEREMDLHNDEVGIQIGKEVDEETFSIIELFKSKDLDLIAERIMDEMRAGNLITHV